MLRASPERSEGASSLGMLGAGLGESSSWNREMNEVAFCNRVFAGSLHHATITGGGLLFEPSRALSALESIARSGAHIAVVECWAGTFELYAIMDRCKLPP